jgi:hypothetical protein
MAEKKAVVRETRAEYRKATGKGKTLILDQFVRLTGYNRKYAIRVLNEKETAEATLVVNGRTVKLKADRKARPRNRLGKTVYTQETVAALERIWAFHWYKCGPYLAAYIRDNIDFLQRSRKPQFHITPEIRAQLTAISGRQIDRVLRPAKDALRLKGISGTRLAEQRLLKQVPVRTQYTAEERQNPGYCQVDTVHHCGETDRGEFNLTLTVTDVYSGWVWLAGLLNKAHKWTLEALQSVYLTALFRILEFHTDNGSEFINKDTIDWRQLTKTLLLTRSRAYHKNDNCFAEQKNNAFVRNYVGHGRYDTEAELAALNRVYESLCPLLNFFIPNKRLVSKTTVGSKTVKKYDLPRTPYQRLMGSPLDEETKARLAAERALYNPVELQYKVNKAIDGLLAAHTAKVTFSK